MGLCDEDVEMLNVIEHNENNHNNLKNVIMDKMFIKYFELYKLYMYMDYAYGHLHTRCHII